MGAKQRARLTIAGDVRVGHHTPRRCPAAAAVISRFPRRALRAGEPGEAHRPAANTLERV
jgi:hypothetical protein